MVRTLKKGYPDRDTVSNSKFHSKEVIVVRIHAAGPVTVVGVMTLCVFMRHKASYHHFRMHTANFYSRQNFWEAVQLGTVVEIGVRFPAILQHPVLYALIV
jgi:hypothetical protein